MVHWEKSVAKIKLRLEKNDQWINECSFGARKQIMGL